MSTTTTTAISFERRIFKYHGQGVEVATPCYQRVDVPECDKSIITPSYSPAPNHALPASESALLRAVTDFIGAQLKDDFLGAISDHLHFVPASHPERQDFMLMDQILRDPAFKRDAAFLSLVINGEFVMSRGRTATVPACVQLLWDKVLEGNPWIRNYVYAAAQIQNECSEILHGVGIQWEDGDLDTALARSEFTREVQDAIREIAVCAPFIRQRAALAEEEV
ncbi:hypothetical protein C8F01DRAFT_1127700 [Mycena amicta]|nr:hypothetical protein C8F01DRAFT_1127700 [Mycena amicta]